MRSIRFVTTKTVSISAPRSAKARATIVRCERYERNSVKTYTSLAVLNTGQAVIFTAGA